MFRICLILLLVGSMHCVARRPKKCKISDSMDDLLTCPSTTYCEKIKDPANRDIGYGECKCTVQYEFNPNYTDDNNYCIAVAPSAYTKRIRSESETKHEDMLKQQQYSKEHQQQQLVETSTDPETAATLAARQRRPPSTHHIIGGIVIPIMIVFTAMGAVFVAKKMLVIQRLRNLMTTRRTRPLYEDVMMANDRDDPPLI